MKVGRSDLKMKDTPLAGEWYIVKNPPYHTLGREGLSDLKRAP
jgi:hypothetical protein